MDFSIQDGLVSLRRCSGGGWPLVGGVAAGEAPGSHAHSCSPPLRRAVVASPLDEVAQPSAAAGAAPGIIGCNCAGRGRCDLRSWRNVRRGPVDLLPLDGESWAAEINAAGLVGLGLRLCGVRKIGPLSARGDRPAGRIDDVYGATASRRRGGARTQWRPSGRSRRPFLGGKWQRATRGCTPT